MNLTHGQKVWCEIDTQKHRGTISINPEGDAWLCQNAQYAFSDCKEMFGYKYAMPLSVEDGETEYLVLSLYKVKPYKDINDITTYEVGDVLVCDEPENEALVVEVFTNTVAVVWNRNRLIWPKLWTIPTIISEGYTKFKDIPEPQKTTVTRQEIADWKGVDVDSIVIE